MFIQQFFVPGLAHSSYLLGGSKSCAIIDPQRDVSVYCETAKTLGLTITHVLQTHLHADFVSGHMDLAQKTGAAIYCPKSGYCVFNHVAVAENDTFLLEEMKITVLETPGHTPEHCTYVVTDTSRSPEPVCIFCGDTLFVGDVGRPDLFPDKAIQLANQLYESIHTKLLNLPDFCEVYPAHGAGSLCGRAMGAKRTSTIGYERRYNSACLINERSRFVESLTTNMPAAPDHFSRCSDINRKGPQTIESIPQVKNLLPHEFHARLHDSSRKTIVLDTRSYESFGGLHIPNSLHIDFGGNFSTFAGWVVPVDADILLVCEDVKQVDLVVKALQRVGLDRVVGFLEAGIFAWAKAGYTCSHIGQLSVDEVHDISCGDKKITIIDVRAIREFDAAHINGAINIPAPDLRFRYKELDPSVPLVLICSTGHRSSLAASILAQHGFKLVFNAAGGMSAFSSRGFAPECAMCVTPHASTYFGKKQG
ncbi:MAG: MBL fold metallo-hydrolase [Chitinivibrionales bacterium]|nr:MBL fold metallo-hydrolase [Chitinivibrionales bacterium]